MADVKITALAPISANPVNPATFPIPMVDLLDNSMAESGTTKKVTVNQILGAGGTATLASATITGAATVGTTLGVTGQSTLTGNVGVGVTPTAWGVGTKALQVGSTAFGSLFDFLTDFVAVTANLHWTGANYGRMSASSKFATAYYQEIATGAHQWLSSTAAGTNVVAPTMVANMTLTAAGNLSLANGDFVVSNGKGIDFSATSSGSGTMTSEVLNDYEEGTWTPVVKFGTTTATQSNTKTSYTKIGRQVTCFIETYITNLNGGTGNFELSGLPFTSMAMRSAQGDFLFQFMSASFPSGDKMAFINDSSTSFGILYFTGASGTALPLTDADFTTSSYLYARIVYFV